MRKLSRHLCFLVLLLCVTSLGGGNLYGQESGTQDSEDTTCEELYSMIKQEHLQGHFGVMNALITKYRERGCFDADAVHTIDVLEIVKSQLLEDNYRMREADSVQNQIIAIYRDMYKGSRYNGYKFRFGAGVTYDYPFSVDHIHKRDFWMFGMFSPHFTAGYRFRNRKRGDDITYTAIDLGYCFQRMAFSINARNNKDENNSNLSGGFILRTNGHNEYQNFSAVASWNKEPLSTGIGYGVFTGIEVLEIWDTYIDNYYYEYGYRDSIIQQSPTSSHVISSYNVFSQQDFGNVNFFRNYFMINVPLGLNLHYKFRGRFLSTLSAYGSFPFGKLEVSGIDYSRRIGYFGAKLTCSYLFRKEKS